MKKMRKKYPQSRQQSSQNRTCDQEMKDGTWRILVALNAIIQRDKEVVIIVIIQNTKINVQKHHNHSVSLRMEKNLKSYILVLSALLNEVISDLEEVSLILNWLSDVDVVDVVNNGSILTVVLHVTITNRDIEVDALVQPEGLRNETSVQTLAETRRTYESACYQDG